MHTFLRSFFKLSALILGFALIFPTIGLSALNDVELSAGDAPILRAGEVDQEVASMFLTEKVPAALPAGSNVTLELPDDCMWNQIPVVKVLSGDIVLEAGQFVADSKRHMVSYLVKKASTASSDLEFASGTIDIEAGADPGNIVTVVKNTGEVGVATINNTVDVEDAAVPEVVVGQQNQLARNITITETSPGSILANPNNMQGHLYLILPEGISFSSVPDVNVNGNLKIDSGNVLLTSNNSGAQDNTLDIPILKSSTGSASQIVISNLQITLDRTVPLGTIFAVLRGSAIDAISAQTAGDDPSLYTRNISTFTIAKGVDEISAPVPNNGSFTLGSDSYMINGDSRTMDGIPYVKNERVFVPYRYLAMVLGIPDDQEHLMWDEASQTVTIHSLKGDSVAATVGNSILTVNEQAIQMDVAAEQVSGRVFLPARWLTEALGGTVNWEASTQQVLVTISY